MKSSQACRELRRVSKHVNRWLRAQPNVGEESLTDWMLYSLSSRLPWVKYRKFTRYQESHQSGADWEWWFVSQNAALGARVQAKKFDPGADVYPALAYKPRTGLQIKTLLQASARDSLVPLYILYTSLPKPRVLCPLKPKRKTGDGAFVAVAQQVYDLFVRPGRVKILADSVVQRSNPLSCLMCCPLVASDDPVLGLWKHFSQYFRAGEYTGVDLLRPAAPAHVMALMGENEAPPDRERGDIGALVVFDLREESAPDRFAAVRTHGWSRDCDPPSNFGVKLSAGWCPARRPSRLQCRQLHGVTPAADRSRRGSR